MSLLTRVIAGFYSPSGVFTARSVTPTIYSYEIKINLAANLISGINYSDHRWFEKLRAYILSPTVAMRSGVDMPAAGSGHVAVMDFEGTATIEARFDVLGADQIPVKIRSTFADIVEAIPSYPTLEDAQTIYQRNRIVTKHTDVQMTTDVMLFTSHAVRAFVLQPDVVTLSGVETDFHHRLRTIVTLDAFDAQMRSDADHLPAWNRVNRYRAVFTPLVNVRSEIDGNVWANTQPQFRSPPATLETSAKSVHAFDAWKFTQPQFRSDPTITSVEGQALSGMYGTGVFARGENNTAADAPFIRDVLSVWEDATLSPSVATTNWGYISEPMKETSVEGGTPFIQMSPIDYRLTDAIVYWDTKDARTWTKSSTFYNPYGSTANASATVSGGYAPWDVNTNDPSMLLSTTSSYLQIPISRPKDEVFTLEVRYKVIQWYASQYVIRLGDLFTYRRFGGNAEDCELKFANVDVTGNLPMGGGFETHAFTWDGTDFRVYQNGIEVAVSQPDLTHLLTRDNSFLRLGEPSSLGFRGYFTSVRYYNAVLTPLDLQQHVATSDPV